MGPSPSKVREAAMAALEELASPSSLIASRALCAVSAGIAIAWCPGNRRLTLADEFLLGALDSHTSDQDHAGAA